LGTIPWEGKKDVDPSIFKPKESTPPARAGFKRTMIGWIRACSNFFPRRSGAMVAIETYIRPIDLMKLQLSMRMLPRPYYGVDIDVMPFEVDWEMRRNLGLNQGENRFESILKEYIPLHIPKVYVEGYSRLAQRAMEVFPKKNKVILTSNAYMADEGFKFWAADQVSRGAKLAITQHGGHVGDGLWSTDDDHEFKIADRYFTWGWAREGESTGVPLPSSMLRRGRGCKPNPDGAILCVAVGCQSFPPAV
jgi:putative transferase (TIGR04331 family)